MKNKNQNPKRKPKLKKNTKRHEKPIVDELANELIQERRESALKLSDFTPLNEAPDTPIWQTIRALYASRNLADKVKAMILNGVETCRKKRFILSFDILCDHINQDPNIDRVGLNGSEHKEVMKRLAGTLTGAFLECKIQPSSGRPKTGEQSKAGTYEISHPKVIQRLEWWDDSLILRDSLRDIPTPVVVDVVEDVVNTQNTKLNLTPDHAVPAIAHRGDPMTEIEKRAATALSTFRLLGNLPETMGELLGERDLYEHDLREMSDDGLKVLFTEHFENMAKSEPAA